MVAVRRLLMGGGGAVTITREMPVSWGITRSVNNPLITVTGGEPNEMYNPAPVRLSNGNVIVYVKGALRIYAWLSTDGGETFSLANGGNQVIAPGAAGQWDDGAAVEPFAFADDATELIHLYYGGRDGADNTTWGWGHATAPYATPYTFTKDAANPILTSATVKTALGGGTMGDLKINEVIKIGSTYHFYGYTLYNDFYRIIEATGSTLINPSGISAILTAADSFSGAGANSVVQSPSIIEIPGMGLPLYAMLYSRGGVQPAARTVRTASSPDGVTWDFSVTTDIISPIGTGWEEDETYAGRFLKESQSPWLAPYSSPYKFYYSGLEDAVAQSGLIYMEPVY
jgi:hypothetical protein